MKTEKKKKKRCGSLKGEGGARLGRREPIETRGGRNGLKRDNTKKGTKNRHKKREDIGPM